MLRAGEQQHVRWASSRCRNTAKMVFATQTRLSPHHMGPSAKILLVINSSIKPVSCLSTANLRPCRLNLINNVFRRDVSLLRKGFLFAMSLWLSGPTFANVVAAQYREFWLWGGVTPQTVLAKARTIYVLQGEIQAGAKNMPASTIISQGVPIPDASPSNIWLVYRVDTLRWSPHILHLILERLYRWRARGIRTLGIQIDFDAHTQHLRNYASFLHTLRAELPKDCQLSITGLLDWSTTATAEDINHLSRDINELVVQTYQGRHTIPDYARYVAGLQHLRVPFKVGLIQNGKWDDTISFTSNPWFRGEVIFLQNPHTPINFVSYPK